VTHRFTAQVDCGLDDEGEDDCVIAGLAESDDPDAFTLLFMCDFEQPDPRSVALGLDTNCLVTRDQGTAYGCVREVIPSGDVLRVALDPAALDNLGLDHPVIEAVLQAPSDDVDRMRTVLRRVLSYGRPEARPTRIEL